MTDEQLADFLGFPKDEPKRIAAVQKLTAKERAKYERLAGVVGEIQLWDAGLGPLPPGIFVDTDRTVNP